MISTSNGMTRTYNAVHSPSNTDAAIEGIRRIHRSIDQELVDCYAWDGIELGHDFHEVAYLPESDRIRFTMSEPARLEVLRHLADLNRQRYQEEVDQGLHGGTAGSVKARGRKSRSTSGSVLTLDLDDILSPAIEGGD